MLHKCYGFLDSGCTNGPKYEFQPSWNNILKMLGRKDASIELKLCVPISHFCEMHDLQPAQSIGTQWLGGAEATPEPVWKGSLMRNGSNNMGWIVKQDETEQPIYGNCQTTANNLLSVRAL
jgi:hypothetical protein